MHKHSGSVIQNRTNTLFYKFGLPIDLGLKKAFQKKSQLTKKQINVSKSYIFTTFKRLTHHCVSRGWAQEGGIDFFFDLSKSVASGP